MNDNLNNIKYTCFLLCFSILANTLQAQNPKKLLILGIDGCRSDALLAANTPNLDSLMNTGTFSMDARTVYPTYSGPGWSSMLTGVWYTKHGVTNNLFIPSNISNYPHFFNHIEQVNPSLRTASVCQWGPVNDNIVNLADFKINTSSGASTASNAITQISSTSPNPDVVFVHFDDVDHEGHTTGFGPSNPLYITAIEQVDGYIGSILNALRSRPNYSTEDWLVLVSTDHGGTGTNHGGSSLIERRNFLIMNGVGLPAYEFVPEVSAIPANAVLNFANSNQYAAAPHNANFDFGATTDFTIECRVKTAGWSGDPSIVSNKNWNSGYNDGFFIGGNTDGATWKVNLGDGAFNRVDLDGGPINDGLWHHLAISVDRNGEIRLFQDGRMIAVDNVSSIGNINNSNPIGIGQDGTLNYSDGFNGQIDEVRVWRTVVPDSVIAQWGGQGLQNNHPNYTNLAGYWKLDEGSGSTSADASSIGTTVAISGATWATANTMNYTNYWKFPLMVDLAPTALTHLCIPINPSWGLQGRSLVECNTNTSTEILSDKESAALLLYPNPVGNQLTVVFPAFLTEDYTLQVIDVQGRVVALLSGRSTAMTSLDVQGLPSGVYLLQLRSKSLSTSLTFVKN